MCALYWHSKQPMLGVTKKPEILLFCIPIFTTSYEIWAHNGWYRICIFCSLDKTKLCIKEVVLDAVYAFVLLVHKCTMMHCLIIYSVMFALQIDHKAFPMQNFHMIFFGGSGFAFSSLAASANHNQFAHFCKSKNYPGIWRVSSKSPYWL